MTDATTPSARILVVDDNDDNRYTLTLYLELEGYADIQIAEDGAEAIARLDKEGFDVVLLDVMMPKVDGYQVLSWLKDQRRLHDLPVIMISALNEMTSVVRCIELGAVDYLLKPFNQVLLKARLGACLERKRLHDQVNAHLFRLEQELEAARDLQMSMLPQVFPPPVRQCPVDVWGLVHPAREDIDATRRPGHRGGRAVDDAPERFPVDPATGEPLVPQRVVGALYEGVEPFARP